MSPTQAKYNSKIEGGFLGAFLGLGKTFLPKILGALGLGALSGAAQTGISEAMGGGLESGSGLYLKKGGCFCEVTQKSEGLCLRSTYRPPFARGNGLYLKRGSGLKKLLKV